MSTDLPVEYLNTHGVFIAVTYIGPCGRTQVATDCQMSSAVMLCSHAMLMHRHRVMDRVTPFERGTDQSNADMGCACISP